MNRYQVWHVDVPMEYVDAGSGLAARQDFARRHHKPVSECRARRLISPPARVFSDGTSIRDEP